MLGVVSGYGQVHAKVGVLAYENPQEHVLKLVSGEVPAQEITVEVNRLAFVRFVNGVGRHPQWGAEFARPDRNMDRLHPMFASVSAGWGNDLGVVASVAGVPRLINRVHYADRSALVLDLKAKFGRVENAVLEVVPFFDFDGEEGLKLGRGDFLGLNEHTLGMLGCIASIDERSAKKVEANPREYYGDDRHPRHDGLSGKITKQPPGILIPIPVFLLIVLAIGWVSGFLIEHLSQSSDTPWRAVLIYFWGAHGCCGPDAPVGLDGFWWAVRE